MIDARTVTNVRRWALAVALAYPMICTKHTPNMQGTLVVLPK